MLSNAFTNSYHHFHKNDLAIKRNDVFLKLNFFIISSSKIKFLSFNNGYKTPSLKIKSFLSNFNSSIQYLINSS